MNNLHDKLVPYDSIELNGEASPTLLTKTKLCTSTGQVPNVSTYDKLKTVSNLINFLVNLIAHHPYPPL
jgi:hypothetical protein